MPRLEVEVYFGYYLGDAQMWDTNYVYLPADTPEDKVKQLALDMFHAKIDPDISLAFTGIFHIGEEEALDD